MANVDITCANCGATAPAPSDGTPVKCMFCGGSIQYVPDKVESGSQTSPQIENLFLLAESATEAENYEEANTYYNRVIEIDTTNARAWVGKGLSAVWQSTLANIRSGEMLPAFKNAMKFASDASAKEAALDRMVDDVGRAYNALGILSRNIWKSHGTTYALDVLVPDSDEAAEYRGRISTWIDEYGGFYDWFDEHAAALEEAGGTAKREQWTLILDYWFVELLDYIWIGSTLEGLGFQTSGWDTTWFKDELHLTEANDMGHPWSGHAHPVDWDIYGIYAAAVINRHEQRDYSSFSEDIVEKYEIHDPRKYAPVDASGGSGFCFIATATFSEFDNKELSWLRSFRDNTLLTRSGGRAFVRWYYQHGPGLARMLSGTRVTRLITRYVLLSFARVGLFWNPYSDRRDGGSEVERQ